jgi:hypothetical protein
VLLHGIAPIEPGGDLAEYLAPGPSRLSTQIPPQVLIQER